MTPDRPAGQRRFDPGCEYCDQVAVLIGRDTADRLCADCGADQYDDPAYSLARLTDATYLRYGNQRP